MIKQWLSRQAFWQVYLPAPKRINRPHYQVTTPNEMHQFDMLYMPSDTLYGNKYKYILAGIDVASRFKVARPLRTKQARDVAEMIADIYKVGPLTLLSMGGRGPYSFSSISLERLELRASNFLTFSFYLLAVRKI